MGARLQIEQDLKAGRDKLNFDGQARDQVRYVVGYHSVTPDMGRSRIKTAEMFWGGGRGGPNLC